MIEGYPLFERCSVSLNMQLTTDSDVKAALEGLIGFPSHLLAGCQIVVDGVMESFFQRLHALPIEHDQVVDRFDLAEEDLIIRFKVDGSDIAFLYSFTSFILIPLSLSLNQSIVLLDDPFVFSFAFASANGAFS